MKLIQPMSADYAEYLHDESQTMGTAEYITFPRTTAEIAEAVRYCYENQIPINPQGGLTGLSGGASPQGGLILNLSRMNKIVDVEKDAEGTYYLHVQPGIRLIEVRKALSSKNIVIEGLSAEKAALLQELLSQDLFFSPDPTEPTASIGGMASCNACGARSFLYGCTREYVSGLTVVLSDGRTALLERGRDKVAGRSFTIRCTDGTTLSGELPAFNTPAIKDAGYFIRDNMDILDLFIGSQGTLGVIAELKLKLLPSPKRMWGAIAFFPDDAAAIKYVHTLKSDGICRDMAPFSVKPASLEFFNEQALDYVWEERRTNESYQQRIPAYPEGMHTAVYAEFNLSDPDLFDPLLEELLDVLEKVGGDPEKTWLAANEAELQNLLFFRHAVPEVIDFWVARNKKNYDGITILSTDMAVDHAHFDELFAIYNRDLQASGLPYLIFGHIGENHVHPNILARNKEEYEAGHRLFEHWAEVVSGMGGTITAEHGAGKIKRKLAYILYGPEKMRELNHLKRTLDPRHILALGNILTEMPD